MKTENQENNSLEILTRAEVDIQIATAKRYPRDISKVKKEMLEFATLDEETAAGCFYSIPRGDKLIQGASVRMAEIAIACYGNIKTATRVIEIVAEGSNPHVVIQAVAIDIQNNCSVSIEKRRRITKKKSKDFVDEDDINLAVNACSAIAFRDAAFKIIPMAFIKPVYEQAKRVAVGDLKSVTEKRTVVIERLKKMGATMEKILAVVGKKKEADIGLDELGVLIGIGTSLKDGDLTLEDAFPTLKSDLNLNTKTEPKIVKVAAMDEPLTNRDKLWAMMDEAEISNVSFETKLRDLGYLIPSQNLSTLSEDNFAVLIKDFNKILNK